MDHGRRRLSATRIFALIALLLATASRAEGATVKIFTLANNQWTPNAVTINVGDTINFVNNASGEYTEVRRKIWFDHNHVKRQQPSFIHCIHTIHIHIHIHIYTYIYTYTY